MPPREDAPTRCGCHRSTRSPPMNPRCARTTPPASNVEHPRVVPRQRPPTHEARFDTLKLAGYGHPSSRGLGSLPNGGAPGRLPARHSREPTLEVGVPKKSRPVHGCREVHTISLSNALGSDPKASLHRLHVAASSRSRTSKTLVRCGGGSSAALGDLARRPWRKRYPRQCRPRSEGQLRSGDR
jgi:hypothetical protein